jgi:hypothetical protein
LRVLAIKIQIFIVRSKLGSFVEFYCEFNSRVRVLPSRGLSLRIGYVAIVSARIQAEDSTMSLELGRSSRKKVTLDHQIFTRWPARRHCGAGC